MPDSSRTDVAIVGMAAMFPGAPDLGRYWDNIAAGVDSVTAVPATRWDPSYFDADAWSQPASDKFYCRRGGFIDDIATFDPSSFGIMPLAVDSTEPDQLLALKTAAAAVADAGGEGGLGDRTKVGVILGRGGYLSAGGARLDQRVRAGRQLVLSLRELVPGLDESQLERARQDFQDRLGPERPESSIGLVPNLAASRIANRLDLQGPAYTVDAACASSLLAVDHGVRELASGRCDLVIAGGVHVCDDVTLWSVFSQLRALSPSQQIRPFDRRADGLLIGEGIGMIVLKRLADAEASGDRIYAVVRGVGVASDGRDASLMRPRVAGQVLALHRAWAAAGLDPTAPGALSMIEAHGTGTPVGDEAELTTLGQVFGSDGPPIGVGSVKSMIGHAMPAAGMAGLIKAALAIHHQVLPPTLHCEEPHPALAGGRLQPMTAGAAWPGEAGSPRRAAVNAFGFGGINAHVILQEPPDARDRVARRRPAPVVRCDRALLLAGADAAAVARQLAVADSVLLGRNDLSSAPTAAAGPCRLAIVDPNPTRLELARKVAARGRSWRGRNDVWFTTSPLLSDPAAKVAFLFPGIEQTFDPQTDGVADFFGLDDPQLGGTQSLGTHGVATVLVGRLLHAALGELGIRPDLVGGHSIGEWNAMMAAGMYDADAVDSFIESFDTEALEVPGVVFAALGCGADMAEAAIAGLDNTVVSHDNCPHQSIICGESASVAVALDRLKAEGVMGQVLSFRSGFHSPMLEPYLGPVGDLLNGLRLQAAAIPVWSATTVGPYPADLDEVRRLVVRHLLEPVRFGPLVRRLHDEGVRAFVQVGSGSLTGFIDDTLRDREQLVISASTPKNSGLNQLLRVAVALWVEGLQPALARFAPHEAAGHPMTLKLGTPFVRGARPLAISPPVAVTPTIGNPVMAEFEALLSDSSDAATAVLQSWRAPAPVLPTTSTTTRVLSPETMPYLLHHCFYRQRDGWPSTADRFPVVPMTTMLELMMDGARPLAGGRTIVGITKVRALKWLAITEPVSLVVTAAADADGNIDVALEGYARGKVMVADCYPAAPPAATEALRGERPSEVSARQLYEDRWLFHGPEFQGVTEVQAVAGNGIRGRLTSLAAPGGLLDNAGQLMGFWIRTTVEANKLAFPTSIESIQLFGPHPTPGQDLDCTVWVRSVTDANVTADLEVRSPNGVVWASITAWQDHRFLTDGAVDPILRWPESNRIAETQPGGWLLLRDRWPDPANRELIMRRYLAASERHHYDQQSPRARHRWLLGRIAAKDAVRQWLWDRGSGPLYPAELVIENEPSGQPIVTGQPVEISIAHSGELAVALVGHGGGVGVGIDVEAVSERGAQFEPMTCTLAERALLDLCAAGLGSRLECVTRFWSAKEAVAKAVGTGLGGRPHRFEVQAIETGRLLVAALDHGSARWWVDTRLVPGSTGTYVVAWTAAPAPPLSAPNAATPGFPIPNLTKETTTNGR